MRIFGNCAPQISGHWQRFSCRCSPVECAWPGSVALETEKLKCAQYSQYNSTAANRLHQAARALQEIRSYSPEEIELAWMLSQYDGHDPRYSYDTTGLAYLNGAVLAGMAARSCQLPLQQTYRYEEKRTVPPVGSALDVRL